MRESVQFMHGAMMLPPPPFLHHFLFTDEGKCFDGCCIFERESIPLLFVITAEPEGMTAEP